MKELESTPKLELKEVREIRKESEHIATMQPQKGQKVYKLDTISNGFGEVTADDYEKSSVGLNGGVTRKLVIKKGTMYCLAINPKNAKRKFRQLLSKYRQ